MICPCFDTTFVGFCVASPTRHVPSVAEKQGCCFSESFVRCPRFAKSQAVAVSAADDRPSDLIREGAVRSSRETSVQ